MEILLAIARLASIYAVIALGYVVVYRTSRVLNLAHPGLILLGAYVVAEVLPGVTEAQEAPLTYAASIVGLIVGGALVSVGLYYLFIRPMAGQSRITIIMVTLAVLFLLQAISRYQWRGENRFVPVPGRTIAYEFELVRIRLFDLLPIVIAVVVVALVVLLYQRSRFGVQMRAVAENAALAARRGIDIDRIGAMSWGLAGALAIVAVFSLGMHGPVSPLLVGVALKAFAVALVGGLDSVSGLVPAAVLVAASEILVVTYVDQQLAEAVPFLVLLVVLVIRPWGLAGTVEELERV